MPTQAQALPFRIIASNPALQARLSAALDGGGHDGLFADDLPEARRNLPELAFLSDDALEGVISRWSTDYLGMSWDCPDNREERFGLYVLGQLAPNLSRTDLFGPGRKILQQYI